MDKETKKILFEPLVDNNPITLQVLGVCSALAVTSQSAARWSGLRLQLATKHQFNPRSVYRECTRSSSRLFRPGSSAENRSVWRGTRDPHPRTQGQGGRAATRLRGACAAEALMKTAVCVRQHAVQTCCARGQMLLGRRADSAIDRSAQFVCRRAGPIGR